MTDDDPADAARPPARRPVDAARDRRPARAADPPRPPGDASTRRSATGSARPATSPRSGRRRPGPRGCGRWPRSRGRSPSAAHAEQAPLAGQRADGGAAPRSIRSSSGPRSTCAELCAELAEIGELPGCEPPDLAEAAEAIESATVRLWRGPAEGRVRILDPYRIRAGRARHLFCAGLQEGEFPRRSARRPAARRRPPRHARASRRWGAAIRSTRSATCFTPASRARPSASISPGSRPTTTARRRRARRSSTRSSTCSGPTPRPRAELLTARRGLERVTFAPDEAPTAARAARAPRRSPGRGSRSTKPGPLAGAGGARRAGRARAAQREHARALARVPVSLVRRARAAPAAPRSPRATRCGSARSPTTRSRRLYADPPGDDAIPRPGDLGALAARGSASCSTRSPASTGCAPSARSTRSPSPACAPRSARFLDEEAEAETELRPRPDLLEAGFGFEEDGDGRAPLDLGAARLRGRIDRIDLAPDGAARWCATTRPAARSPAASGWERARQAPAPALHPRRPRAARPGPDRRPLHRARRPQRPPPARDRDLQDDPRLGEPASHGRRRPLRRRGVRRRARARRARRHRRRRRRCARARSTATRSAAAVRRYCTLPADLPARARARARGRDQRRERPRPTASETAA